MLVQHHVGYLDLDRAFEGQLVREHLIQAQCERVDVHLDVRLMQNTLNNKCILAYVCFVLSGKSPVSPCIS